MCLVVESGIPIKTRKSKYPFGEMGVGDSFFAPKEFDVRNVRWAASQFAKSHGLKFVTRIEGDGCRCWRVE